MKLREKTSLFIKENRLQVNDIDLMVTALTHPSYAQEHEGVENNQRLEFLGDAVLNLAVAEYLYRSF